MIHPSQGLYSEVPELRARHKLSWSDCLIIAAAAQAGCSTVYTEDMQHGTVIRGVRIVNPFLRN